MGGLRWLCILFSRLFSFGKPDDFFGDQKSLDIWCISDPFFFHTLQTLHGSKPWSHGDNLSHPTWNTTKKSIPGPKEWLMVNPQTQQWCWSLQSKSKIKRTQPYPSRPPMQWHSPHTSTKWFGPIGHEALHCHHGPFRIASRQRLGCAKALPLPWLWWEQIRIRYCLLNVYWKRCICILGQT